jgi:hypothetical protein
MKKIATIIITLTLLNQVSTSFATPINSVVDPFSIKPISVVNKKTTQLRINGGLMDQSYSVIKDGNKIMVPVEPFFKANKYTINNNKYAYIANKDNRSFTFSYNNGTLIFNNYQSEVKPQIINNMVYLELEEYTALFGVPAKFDYNNDLALIGYDYPKVDKTVNIRATLDEKNEVNKYQNIDSRKYTFSNGDKFTSYRYSFSTRNPVPYQFAYELEGTIKTVRFMQNGQFKIITDLNNIPKEVLFIETTMKNYIVSIPQIYQKDPNFDVTKMLDDKVIPVKIEKSNGKTTLKASFVQDFKHMGDLWILESKETLVDFNDSNIVKIWTNFGLGKTHRWIYSGYMMNVPNSYFPSGVSYFWENPNNYLLRSFVLTGGSRAADDLGLMMLKESVNSQNDLGYWSTGPMSNWLKTDYTIYGSFYDSRYSTDLAYYMIKGYEKYKDESFLQSSKDYFEFLNKMAIENSITVSNGSIDGILLRDYWYDKPFIKTLASLNHNAAIITYLFYSYDITEDNEYLVLAENMLNGIKISKSKWIRTNSDLFYAMLNSNQYMGRTDYQTLTYNDLYVLQKMHTYIYGYLDDDIKYIMDTKKKYMDSKMITGYTK